jgi:hypothetical protein
MKPSLRHVRHTMSAARARGQSMVEYLVAAAIAVAILAVPIGGNPSVIAMMLAAIRTAFARFLGAISLPM